MLVVAAQPAFYEAAAQIIPPAPALVIGESRVFRARYGDVVQWRRAVLVSLMPIVALLRAR
jgi:hypothetical protein